jgi:adenylyltransferase/sulfurtransferase
MHAITSEELAALLRQQYPLRLIDVREPEEHAAFNLGGELIPLQQVMAELSRIPRDILVVFYCRKGIRSALAIQRLQEKYPFTNLANLSGGTEAWKHRFHDPAG